jgi:hypothetical protein
MSSSPYFRNIFHNWRKQLGEYCTWICRQVSILYTSYTKRTLKEISNAVTQNCLLL